VLLVEQGGAHVPEYDLAQILGLVLPKKMEFGVEKVSCEPPTPKTYLGSKQSQDT
jgi:hypothetical protein